MSNILDSKDFGLKLYNRFPPKYREDDVGQRYALKRYIEALCDGGFKHSIDEINGLTHLIDPDKVDAKLLPILYKQYGLDVFNGIPEMYLRYLLPRLGETWSKKGSLSVIEFITSSLSGVRTKTEVNYDDKGNPLIDVKLEMDYNLGDYFPEAEQFNRILKNFLPFYCDMSMVYTYMFYATGILKEKEEDFYFISDNKSDSGSIMSDNTDSILDCVTHSVDELYSPQGNDTYLSQKIDLTQYESGTMERIEAFLINHTSIMINDGGGVISCEEDAFRRVTHSVLESSSITEEEVTSESVTLAPLHDLTKLGGDIELEDTTILTYSESSSIASQGVDSNTEHITRSSEESVGVYQADDSLTNNRLNVLNGGFYTNALYLFDTINLVSQG